MLRMLILSVVLLLAGCATPAERAAQMEREVDEMIQVYGPACDKLGYKRDTDNWRDCVSRLSATVEQRYYYNRPTTTTCFGHRGFFTCDTF